MPANTLSATDFQPFVRRIKKAIHVLSKANGLS